MKTVSSSSVAVSRGSRLEKRITPIGRAARADDDHEPEHEHRVGEDRADDRGLRDDELSFLQGEDDDEQLRQVAERRLQHARDAGAEALAELLGGEGHHPRETGQRDGRQREARHRRPACRSSPTPASAVANATAASAPRSRALSARIGGPCGRERG